MAVIHPGSDSLLKTIGFDHCVGLVNLMRTNMGMGQQPGSMFFFFWFLNSNIAGKLMLEDERCITCTRFEDAEISCLGSLGASVSSAEVDELFGHPGVSTSSATKGGAKPLGQQS